MPSVTIVAAGTPQNLSQSNVPAQPTISVQGTTYDMGGGQQYRQLILQNPPGQTGNVYFSRSQAMVKATLAGVDGVLAPGQSVTLGNGDVGVTLAQYWVDTDTSGNKVLFSAI